MTDSKLVLEFNHFPELAIKFPQAVHDIVEDSAMRIETTMKMSMRTPKHGVRRKATKSGKMHQASAPGEAPAMDTGNLVNSIQYQMTSNTTAEVNVGAEYGVHLEYGTVNMGARPYATPAAEKERPKFIDAMSHLENMLQ